MKETKGIGRVLAAGYFVFWTCQLFAIDAHAYIDPTTTAMLTQIVAGVFISLGFAFAIFRKRLVLFFRKAYFGIMKKSLGKGHKSGRG